MVSNTFILLALSSLALAHPHRHHSWHWGSRPTGGYAQPTAGPTGGVIPVNGTTAVNGTEAGSSNSSTVVMTLTVSPLPQTSTAAPSFTSLATIGQSSGDECDAETDVSAAAAASSTTCTSELTSTTTMTSTQFVTVTVAPASDSAAASSSAAAASSSSADDSSSTTSSLPSLSTEAPSVTTSSTESSTVAVSSVSLVTTASVSAGAFYGQHGYSHGVSSIVSAAAATPVTTLSTAIASSAVASVVSSVASAASSAAAASATSWASSGSSGGKKGLSYNTASLLSAFSGTGMSWAYNWASSAQGTLPSSLNYVPMLWGRNSVGSWSSDAAKAIAAGSTHVLSFNEPDLSTQSNMSPQDAATLHAQAMNPLAGQVGIGSPAITNGGGSSPPMGTVWLQQFFDACKTVGGCKVDFVAMHWYDSATNFAYFKQHVQDVISVAKQNGVQKVWVTEFGTTSGSDSDIANFIDQATSFLDSTAEVERYAYFMATNGILLNNNALSTIGKAYVSDS